MLLKLRDDTHMTSFEGGGRSDEIKNITKSEVRNFTVLAPIP